jgi:hypothetical protein
MKGIRIVGLCGLTLPLLQLVTWYTLSDRFLPGTIVRHLPENTHFAPGTHFEWVCFRRAESKNLTPRQLDLIADILWRRYEYVYLAESDIPPAFIEAHTEQTQTFLSYRRGFTMAFDIEQSGFMWATMQYSSYVSPTGGRQGSRTYVWILFWWICVHRGPMLVS